MNNDKKIKNYGDEDFHGNRGSACKSMKRSFSNRRNKKNRFHFKTASTLYEKNRGSGMLFVERSGTGRAMLNMAVREKTRKRNKKAKKESEANRKICSLSFELI